jgi:predicted MFS family arabinose efflux permease
MPESPFILYPAVLAVGLIVLLTVQEPARELDPSTGVPHSYRQILASAAGAIRNQPNLRFLLMYSNFLPLAGSIIAITLIQPYAVSVGVPAAALGLVILVNNLVNVAGSAVSERMTRRVGERRLLRLAPVVMAIGVIGMGLVPNLAGLAIFGLATFSMAAARPVVESRILSEVPRRVRATILSVDSLIFRLLWAAGSPLVGVVADASSLTTGFVVMGVVTGGMLLITVFRWQRKTAIS